MNDFQTFFDECRSFLPTPRCCTYRRNACYVRPSVLCVHLKVSHQCICIVSNGIETCTVKLKCVYATIPGGLEDERYWLGNS